jgi:alcohol dehydrogenase YqhD (iron-dependent ADH family)
MSAFFGAIGLPTTLRELNVSGDRLDDIASDCTNAGLNTVGNCSKLNKEQVLAILKLAW